MRVVAWRLLETSDELKILEKPVAIRPSISTEVRGAQSVSMEKEKRRVEITHETYETTFRCAQGNHSWSTTSTSLKNVGLEG